MREHAYALALGGLVMVGLWLRLWRLGALALVGDEAIQALAVENILEHGIPLMDSGLIYPRALLYQYMQAALAYLFGLEPFWLRLPSALWGAAAVVPAYLLGKRLFDRPTGLLVAAIVALSSWELELSRYARFYTIFQFFFLVAALCFYRGFMEDETRYKGWFMVSAFVAFWTHGLSMMLGTLFCIPLLASVYSRAQKGVFLVWAAALGGLLIVQRRLLGLLYQWQEPLGPAPDAGVPAVADDLGARLGQAIGIPALKLPDLGLWEMAWHQHTVFVMGLGGVVVLALGYVGYRIGWDGWGRALVAAGMLMASFWYQFGVAAIGLALYLVLYAEPGRIRRDKLLAVAGGTSLILLAGWGVFLVREAGLGVRDLVDICFGFPNVLGYFFKWMVLGWPIMTAVLMVGSLMLLVRYIRDRTQIQPLFMIGILYIPMIVAGLFNTHAESRYIFHLYPLVVMVYAFMMMRGVRWVQGRLPEYRAPVYRGVMTVCILGALWMSGDVSPAYTWGLVTRDYKSARDPLRGPVTWRYYATYHQDYEQPGQCVRQRLSAEDRVIALGPVHTIALFDYYVGRVDYVVAPAFDEGDPTRHPKGYARMRNGVPIHYINGSEILMNEAALRALVEADGSALWLLGDRPLLHKANGYYDESLKAYLRQFTEKPDCIGRDDKSFAVRLR